MKQQSLASQGVFEKYGRKSRRELFLEEMERVVPWSALESLVRPHYAKAGNGRQPVGLSIMLRTYFVQQWFNLSDPGVEEALYESAALRRFVGVDLGVAPAPDETTICRFRHLLEKHDLGGLMLEAVNVHLEAKGIRIATGTIVDATIIDAPSSTKNQSGERDPEMHQTRKGTQWYFGLKAHIGVDSKEGVVHSVCTSAASVADKHMVTRLGIVWRRLRSRSHPSASVMKSFRENLACELFDEGEFWVDHRSAAFSISGRAILLYGRSANLRYSVIDNRSRAFASRVRRESSTSIVNHG